MENSPMRNVHGSNRLSILETGMQMIGIVVKHRVIQDKSMIVRTTCEQSVDDTNRNKANWITMTETKYTNGVFVVTKLFNN